MKRKICYSALWIFCLVLMSTSFAFIEVEENWEDKVSPNLLSKATQGKQVDCIILFKEQADVRAAKSLNTKESKAIFVHRELKKIAQQTQANVQYILKTAGADYRSFYVVNAIHAKVDLSTLKQLASQEEVDRIFENSLVVQEKVLWEESQNLRGPEPEWGIRMMGADKVWEMGYRGQGVVIGGQDTGYEWEHSVLKKQYRGWQENGADHAYNWHDAIHEINLLHNDTDPSDPTNNPCGLDSNVPCDDGSHGTHTMGTMIGEDEENKIGVAPGARWIACRNMERSYGSPATYIECFEWFLAPTDLNDENANPLLAPHVINNSWSCPEMEGCNPDNFGLMETVVNNLKRSGVVVVVSAGNSGSQGCGSISTPSAIFENSFTIGATAENDTIAKFSSRGLVLVDGSNRMKPNVAAPGVKVRSSVRNGGFANASGTSMSGPHVAGLVALIISANPALAGQVELIEDIIEETAVPKTDTLACSGVVGTNLPNAVYGFGRVNALAAVEKARKITIPSFETTHKFYPVPFVNELQLELKNWYGQTNFYLYNALGQQVKTGSWKIPSQGIKNISLDLSSLSSGLYFYELENGNILQSGKLIKN